MQANVLNGKVAIVTGASRGIGRHIALAFAREGADLVVNATNTALLQSLAGEIAALGRKCVIAVGSVADSQTAQDMVRAALDAFGRIDIVVNNAGVMNRKGTLELTIDEWHRVLDVNANGVFYVCKAVLPVMVEQHGGTILNITSTASKAAHLSLIHI